MSWRCFKIFAWVTIAIAHGGDLIVAFFAKFDLENLSAGFFYWNPGLKPAIEVTCRFDYFSRFSKVHSWYVFVRLIAMGFLLLFEIFVKFVNFCTKKKFANPIINSPFSDWAKMTKAEKATAVILAISSVLVTSIYVAGEIIYLLQGNSELRQILSLSSVFFAIVAPLQIMWLNQDLRHLMTTVLCCRKKRPSNDSQIAAKFDQNANNSIPKPTNKVSLNVNNSSKEKDTRSEFSFCTAF